MATLKNTEINDTGFFTVPAGTTAQRPSGNVAGRLRYNTTTNLLEVSHADGSWTEVSNSVVTTNLVLHLDAGNPGSYPGSGTSWLDVSGLNNNGVLTNGPTYTSGTSGYFTFDGVNDYVNTVTATTLGINSVSTPFTFSIWCKTSGTVEYYLFDNYNGSTQDISFRLDGTNSGAIEVYLNASNNVGFLVLFGSNYNNNAWHNLCITYDGINTLTGYADGSLLGTSTQSGMSGNFESGAALQIGARPTSSSYFPGTISTMMVYNIALTAAQISQNFNALRGRYGI